MSYDTDLLNKAIELIEYILDYTLSDVELDPVSARASDAISILRALQIDIKNLNHDYEN